MQPSPEVTKVIASWFEAVHSGDPTWVDRHLSPRARLIGTDPNEVFEGQAAAGFLKDEASGLGQFAKLTVPSPEAYEEGDVAWGYATPVIAFNDGPTVTPRWTAVFHREGGEWKAVQIHTSLPVSNLEAGFE